MNKWQVCATNKFLGNSKILKTCLKKKGYNRHRARFQQDGWDGFLKEVQLDVSRISSRNLGRDDRIISDHGREVCT